MVPPQFCGPLSTLRMSHGAKVSSVCECSCLATTLASCFLMKKRGEHENSPVGGPLNAVPLFHHLMYFSSKCHETHRSSKVGSRQINVSGRKAVAPRSPLCLWRSRCLDCISPINSLPIQPSPALSPPYALSPFVCLVLYF